MALTPSNAIAAGTIAPDFSLPDTLSHHNLLSLKNLSIEKGLVIFFICNHCPFVKHIQHELVAVAKQYQPKGISFIAISSNDSTAYPEDAPEKMTTVGKSLGYPFPYLFDETQAIAKAYQAACTPDCYVFDNARQCVYHGRIDGSTPGNDIPVTGEDLRSVLEKLAQGKIPEYTFKPSMGCNIKWKA